ncbi:MAG: type II toxin-antitoxin system VapC family toxin [Pirellulales bacterium]
MLDTNACICHLRSVARKDLSLRLSHINRKQVVISTVSQGELLFGARRSQRVDANLAALSEFFRRIRSLPFDSAAAQQYGEIRCDLANRGTMIGANDLIIAAIAMTHGLIVVTHNVSEFKRVNGLAIEDWEGD